MYSVLKILCKLTFSAYFRKIKVSGKENIKGNGPFIFVANHPSAFMDPIAIAISVKQPVYFLAAGEYMGKGLKYKIFKRFLHMIPVYRPNTMPGETHKNAAAFEKCIEHLSTKRSILVFPEGVSVTEKKILPLKTGVARIARDTIISEGEDLNLQIIPIGLNYSDPHTFRSDLYINVGEPISAAEFINQNSEDEKQEVRNLTQHIEDRMIETVLHQENSELEELIDKINATYSRDLKSTLGVAFQDQDREFELNKLTIAVVKHFQKSRPDAYEEMTDLIDDYVQSIENKGIKDKEIRRVNNKVPFYLTLGYFIGAPFFLLGWICNYIPYKLNVIIQNKMGFKDSFKGSMILGFGLALFLVWFILWTVLVWNFTTLSFFSLLVPVIFYLSGTYALLYISSLNYILRRMRLRSYFKKHPAIAQDLTDKRAKLIEKFESFRSDFDKSK